MSTPYNNSTNGFDKAQRAYDNQLPPEDEMVDCEICEGTGKFEHSNCCGANIIMGDICEKCKEHCDKEECDQCEGTGEVPSSKAEREAYEEYMERKADEAREAELMERHERERKMNPSSDKYSGLGECKENE